MRFSSLFLTSALALSWVGSVSIGSIAAEKASMPLAQSSNQPIESSPSAVPEPTDDTVLFIDLDDALTDDDRPSPVSGSVYDDYLFVGLAGQAIDISVNSADFDTYLLLIGPEGELVAENDDIAPDNRDSAIATELPMTGNYLVIVTSFVPEERGAYTLQATTALGTGDLQATLQWDSAHDLDLAVMNPAGEVVSFSNPAGESGGRLDLDANALCSSLTDTPVENIFWPVDQALQGDYVVAVNLYSRCDDSTEPIPFTLTLTVQGETEVLTGTVDEETDIVTFSTAVY